MKYRFFITNTNPDGYSDLIIENQLGIEEAYLPEAVYNIPFGREHSDIMGTKYRVKTKDVMRYVTPDLDYSEKVLDVVSNYIQKKVTVSN